MNLADELRRCQADTLRILGTGAAKRLGYWQKYETDPELVAFIQRVIRGPQRSNGWELDQRGGRSLERIVIDFGAPPFDPKDIEQAKETLNL